MCSFSFALISVRAICEGRRRNKGEMSVRTESLCLLSEGSAALENPSLPLNVTLADLSTNRDAWKFDKDCSLCGIAFGVLKLQHKYRCKFCYRGICEKCSKWTVLHPEFGTKRRCCNACYQKFISLTMREELQSKLDETQARVSRIERTISTVRDDRVDVGEYTKKLAMDAHRLMLQHSKLEGELEKVLGQQREALIRMKAKKGALEAEKQEKEAQMEILRRQQEVRRREIAGVQALVAEAQKLIAENKVLLVRSQEEESALLRLSAQRKQSQDVTKGTAKELKIIISAIQDRCKTLEYNNEQARNQLKETENARKNAEKPLPVEMVTRSPTDDQGETEVDVEADKARYRELMEENYELRRLYTEKQQNEQEESLTFLIKSERTKTTCRTKGAVRDNTPREPRHCGCSLS